MKVHKFYLSRRLLLFAIAALNVLVFSGNLCAQSQSETAKHQVDLQAAMQGDAEAQRDVGYDYLLGKGVPRSPAKAVEWFRKAAEQGDARAQTALGMQLAEGSGVSKNTAEAIQWLEKSALQGGEGAQRLIEMYGQGIHGGAKDELKELHWRKVQAGFGNRGDLYSLGSMYSRGGVKFDADPKEAAKWYQKGAEINDSSCQYELAKSFQKGVGLEKDISQAIFWYRKSATNFRLEAWAALKKIRSEQPQRITENDLKILYDRIESWYRKNENVTGLYSSLLTLGFSRKAEVMLKEIESDAISGAASDGEILKACKLFYGMAENGANEYFQITKQLLKKILSDRMELAKASNSLYSNPTDYIHLLSRTYRKLGEVNAEEKLLREWYELYRDRYIGGGFLVDQTRTYYTTFLIENGGVGKAIEILERTLHEERANWKTDTEFVYKWAVVRELAMAYQKIGRPQDALKVFKAALFYPSEDTFSQESLAEIPDWIFPILPCLYQSAGEYSKASELWLKLQRQETRSGDPSPYTLRGLAIAYDGMGESERAKRLYVKSRERFKDGNYRHPMPGKLGFARLLWKQGNSELAETVLQEHRDGYLSIEGLRRHPNAIPQVFRYSYSNNWQNTLSDFYVVDSQIQKAMAYEEGIQKKASTFAHSRLAYLSGTRRASYLADEFRPTLMRSLSLGFHNRNNPRLAALAAGWLLNGKSVNEEIQAGSALLSKKELAPTVAKLKSVRAQMAAFSLSAKNNDEQAREALADLETQQSNLEQTIADAGLGGNAKQPWKSIGQLMSALPIESRFVSIAKIPIYDFRKSFESGEFHWDDERYVAWIVPPVGYGPVNCVDLGPAEPIDELVSEVRRSLYVTPTNSASVSEQELEDSLKKTLSKLSKFVYAPIASRVTDANELIVSPDSDLWLIPWEILRVDDEYLVERKRIRYLASGRELIREQKLRAGVSRSVVFANPDYDLSAEQIKGASKQLYALRAVKDMQFPALGFSATEAEAIIPSIETFTGIKPKQFLSSEAQESTFKALHRPRVLAISTHGFFDTNKQIPNPLLRCGIALAGANNRKQAIASGKEDGILTGLEIVGTDLRGTELVVLSACETGVGEIQNGEGVAGLRQAFQLAGAESVVSSLWQVEDGETARLMKLFFENLADRKSKSESLRQAQLTRIKTRRARHGAAHPFFWAAFTLTGQD